ncbi:MAG TPA: hypothetical protein VFT69_06720 [Pseudolabrys sp.]|nr:hypothetical protein [Pseudolabrys sp.]
MTFKGAAFGPFFVAVVRIFARVVRLAVNGYIAVMISKAHRIILADHARLPWRFFGRLVVCAQAAL